jgi:DNA helicase-2/ATP-dependent DNA helicase PcrA
VAKLVAYAAREGVSLYDALAEAPRAGLSGKAAKACGELRALFEGWRVAAREVAPSEMIEAVLEESGYRGELKAENTIESEARLENLSELVNAAAEYERVARGLGEAPTLEGFLQEQALYSEADAGDPNAGGSVTLMTLHNAKGLEYDHVFVVGMEEGTFPHARSLDEQNLEEERRLAYVGITRAKKSLTLSHARVRQTYGEREYQLPSRFLAEIPEEFKSGSVTAGSSMGSLTGRGSASKGPAYAVGEKVRHAKFGVGEVVEASGERLVVRFGAQTKTLVPEIAPLSRA